MATLKHLFSYINHSFREGWDNPALTDYGTDRAASSEGYGAQCEYHIIQGAGHGFHGNDRRQSLTYAIRFMSK